MGRWVWMGSEVIKDNRGKKKTKNGHDFLIKVFSVTTKKRQSLKIYDGFEKLQKIVHVNCLRTSQL